MLPLRSTPNCSSASHGVLRARDAWRHLWLRTHCRGLEVVAGTGSGEHSADCGGPRGLDSFGLLSDRELEDGRIHAQKA
jgi:hypothetical protein